jgi:hypothetical protein
MLDIVKYNEDTKAGYKGVYSEHENYSPALYIDPNSNRRPSQKNTLFSVEDLNNYNVASIRVLPITDNYSTTDKFLQRDGTKANSNKKVTSEYIGFILLQVEEQKTEKYELVPLAGDSYASFYYGSQPSQFRFSGITLNTVNDNWRDSFEILYSDYIRGSASIRNKTIVQIKYDNRIATGYITDFSQSVSAESPGTSNFTLVMTITDITLLNKKSQDRPGLLNSFSREIPILETLEKTGLKSKLLSSKRLATMRDYTRTGFLVPPPKPPAPRGNRSKQTLPTCIDTPTKTDDGALRDSQNTVINTGFAESKCTGLDFSVSLQSSYNATKSKLENAIKKANSETDPSKKAKLLNEVQELQSDFLDKSDKIKQLENPDSELSKRVAQQTVEQLEDPATILDESTGSGKKAFKEVYNPQTREKVRVAVLNRQLSKQFVEADDTNKRKQADSINRAAALKVVGEANFVTGEKANTDEEVILKDIDRISEDVTKASRKDANKRASKDIHIEEDQ